MAYFSIVIPTRNRPQVLTLALKSLLSQSFRDFEVIVSDNSSKEFQEENLTIIKKCKNKLNIQYVRPEETLSMHDNWEFALKHAQGEYQGILIDKVMYKSKALETIYKMASVKTPDIINCWNEGMFYFPENVFYKYYYISANYFQTTPFEYAPQEELMRRLSFQDSLREETTLYHRGKICFGFYNQKLVQRIRDKAKKLFFPISCDYSSCALGLAYAESAIDMGEPLMVSMNNFIGNGHTCASNPGALINFLKNMDPELTCLEELPIRGLYSSLHNLCAYDYAILQRLNISNFVLNYENLVQRSVEDLAIFPWQNLLEKKQQYKILADFIKNHLNNNELFEKVREIIESNPNGEEKEHKRVSENSQDKKKFAFLVDFINYRKIKHDEKKNYHILLSKLLER